MKYYRSIPLKNGKECILRNGTAEDAAGVLENFLTAHAETDFLLSYPEECKFTVEQEKEFLTQKENSLYELELIALVDGKIAGTAGIDALGRNFKIRHRTEFGISVLQEFWGLGIGSAMLHACIDCARQAGYTQMELSVAAENSRALAIYKKAGFREYGRNPKGMNSRDTGYQETVLMLLEL